jgi:IMP dehydrogenase
VRVIEPMFVGRTFDDFLMRPMESVVTSRRSISVSSQLTSGLSLELPVVSANMDSVTSGSMAKAMALAGGLGFVHRGMPIETQVREVQGVKRSHGFVIEQPFTLPATARLREAREVMRRHRASLLIETEPGSGVLAGVLSARDLPWFDGHDDRSVAELMTPFEGLVTGVPDVSFEDAEQILFQHRIEKLPLVDGERRIRGLITKQDVMLYRQRPHVSKDAKGRLLVGAATGATGDYLERAAALLATGVDVMLIDVAHAHSKVVRRAVEGFRARFGSVPLVCGNVGTAEGARFLADVGASAIKVGIGPGRGCRTRLETAAGVAQLQAVRECWLELGDEVPIIADGGVKNDKDIFLAIACGASTVMMGSALSGTDEAPGRVIVDPSTGQKRKIYRGMTSPQAVLQGLYGAEEADVDDALETPAEGQEVQVPYKGSVVDILERVRGHLRSSVSYAGGESLAEVRARITADPERYLVPLSEAARTESYER